MVCSICTKDVPVRSQSYMILCYETEIPGNQAEMFPGTPVFVCQECVNTLFVAIDPKVLSALRKLHLVWGMIAGQRLAPCW